MQGGELSRGSCRRRPGRLALGEVDANLARLEALIRSAHREHSAHLIIVPEACTTPNVFHKALLDCVLPLDGKAFQLLTGLAKELDCVIGGGFVAKRGKHAYGTYLLGEPGGAVHLHDKDIPTAWSTTTTWAATTMA